MTHGDNLVPKWAFLALLLIFLFFGEAPAGDSNTPDDTVATTEMVSHTHDLKNTSLADNSTISPEAK